MLLDNKLLIKNKCLIHVSGEGTLVQKKLFNILLYLCFNDLKEQRRFKKPVHEIIDLLGYNKDLNYKQLYNDLKALMRVIISWNIIGLNKKHWVMGAATLLSYIEIEEGFVTYEFSSGLQEKLLENKSYTKINLGIQNVFTSKYSLILYEFCKDYYRSKDLQGESPWVSIREIRHLAGVSDEEYAEFKDLNKRVLNPALKEINNKTDISVKIEFQTTKRKITHIKFHITPNTMNNEDVESFKIKIDPRIAFLKSPEPQTTPPEPTISTTDLLLKSASFGIPDHLINKWIDNKGIEKVNEKLELLIKRDKTQKVASPIGFFITAIQQDWEDETITKELTEEEKKEERRKNPETIMMEPLSFTNEIEFYEEMSKLQANFYVPRWAERDMIQAELNWVS